MSPWRPLIALAAVIVALGGTMIGTGHHTPQLGIDLAGGTSVTMSAKNGTPSSSDMDTAVAIMRNRVNSFGVSEAEVTKQGSKNIQIDVPGKGSDQMLAQIGQTAALYFRTVVPDPTQYGAPARTTVAPATAPPSTPPATTPSGTPSSTPTSKTTTPAKTPTTPTSTSTQHRVVDSALKADTPSATPSGGSATPSTTPTSKASSTPSTPAATPTAPAPAADGSARQTAPDVTTLTLYETIDCRTPPANFSEQSDNPGNYVVGCDRTTYQPYLLGPADVLGKDLSGASARQGQTSTGVVTGNWEVDLSFNSKGAKEFGTVTTALYSNGGKFAVTLDGVVYSAATVNNGPITDGNAMITGNFDQKTATELANVLKFGALPVQFTQSDVSQVSASLAGNQLTGGLIAGVVGLALVMLYLIFYYKGLSVVAIFSLVISAILTYMIATLLGPSINFRLSLAGVAGLVVAIGITADSFVVFFERLRDEVREGRTLRTAVDHGWTRARRTILAADFVSFLAAAVLYMVSAGTVRGFAFTLGLTTLIDIAVVFLFTKPMMTLLARTRFFSGGHKWSGLDPDRLGGRRSGGPRQTIADRRRAASEAEGMEA
jgi:preprotein translocase subunit SecD